MLNGLFSLQSESDWTEHTIVVVGREDVEERLRQLGKNEDNVEERRSKKTETGIICSDEGHDKAGDASLHHIPQNSKYYTITICLFGPIAPSYQAVRFSIPVLQLLNVNHWYSLFEGLLGSFSN